ncbi:MAG: hypothetical protein ACWGG5_07490 [Stenotrophomonas sp.]
MTSFGTWGNQQVTAVDKEKWFTADFNQYFDNGTLNSIDFGVRYADHKREAMSPEGAIAGRHLECAQEWRHRIVSGWLRQQHRRQLPAQPVVFHAGGAEGSDGQQLHLAVRR